MSSTQLDTSGNGGVEGVWKETQNEKEVDGKKDIKHANKFIHVNTRKTRTIQ